MGFRHLLWVDAASEQSTWSTSYTSHHDKFISVYTALSRRVWVWNEASFTLHEKLTPTLAKFRVPDHNNLLHCRETLNFTSQIDVQWNVLETSMSVPFQERSFLSIFSPLVSILNIDTNSHLRLSHLARFLCKATYNQCYSTRRAAVIIITESSH